MGTLELVIGLAIGYFVLGGIVSGWVRQALGQVQSIAGGAAVPTTDNGGGVDEDEEPPYPDDTQGMVYSGDDYDYAYDDEY